MVEGEFRIMNQNFWPGLEDPGSEEYRSMAMTIEREVREGKEMEEGIGRGERTPAPRNTAPWP